MVQLEFMNKEVSGMISEASVHYVLTIMAHIRDLATATG